MDNLLNLENIDDEKKEITYEDIDNSNEFNELQKEELRKGLRKGLDIRYYMDPKYKRKQMREIRKGLESGVDVSKYAYYKFSHKQMKEIREGLEEGINVDVFCSVKIDYRSMNIARFLASRGVDISDIDFTLPYKKVKELLYFE